MPCDTVNIISLDLRVSDRALLKKAAATLGMTLLNNNTLRTQTGSVIRIDGEKASCEASDAPLVNKLRVAYAHQVVDSVAKKLAWQKQVKGSNKLVLRKGF